MKSKRTKALDIPPAVKEKVLERDGVICIWCRRRAGQPNAHFISRAQGGLGIEENILNLCWECHLKYDQSEARGAMREMFREYLQSQYPEWDEAKLYYKK